MSTQPGNHWCSGKGVWVCLYLVLGLNVTSAECVAQVYADAGTEALSSQNFPWYDSEANEIKPVVLPDREDAASNSRNIISARVTSPKVAPGPGLNIQMEWLQIFTWGGVALMIALVIAALVWAYLNISVKAAEAEMNLPPQRSRSESIQQLPFTVDDADGDFRTLASREYQAGNFRQAIIWLFSHVLVTLDQNHLIRLKKGKTNRQYLQELNQSQPLASYYEDVMLPFESTFFGDHPLAAEKFETCWNQLDRFHDDVDTIGRRALTS